MDMDPISIGSEVECYPGVYGRVDAIIDGDVYHPPMRRGGRGVVMRERLAHLTITRVHPRSTSGIRVGDRVETILR